MAAKKSDSKPAASPNWLRFVRMRPRVWASLITLAICGLVGNRVWKHYAPVVARHEQYRLTIDDIVITPLPSWIHADIKAEALGNSGFDNTLSVLDDWPALCQRLSDAFKFHPWVASVRRISRRLPSTLEIELVYRRPVAAVESNDATGIAFHPIDIGAVRLPEKDLTDIELRYLPRITGISGRPRIGDAWKDERVTDGAKLAAELGAVWQQLRLVEIIPSARARARRDQQFYSFELTTSGGTRILWGVAPGHEEAAGESSFAAKRERLLKFAAQNDQLRSIDGPEVVDVRSDLIVTPSSRSAKKKSPAKTTTTK